jgi:hypothetical protein
MACFQWANETQGPNEKSPEMGLFSLKGSGTTLDRFFPPVTHKLFGTF